MFEEEAPRAPVKRADRLQGKKVVVLLDDAVLELAKGRGGSLQLLEGLQHRHLLEREDRDTADVRPDIVHQCLMALQESPLNKAGRLCVFIRTRDKQLIEVHQQLKVPPTYEEFRKLMINLLHTRRIRAVEKKVTLLQIIKNNPELFLPVSCRKIALSAKGRLVDFEGFVSQFAATEIPVFFIVGAVAHSNPTANSDMAEECISISPYGLSAAQSDDALGLTHCQKNYEKGILKEAIYPAAATIRRSRLYLYSHNFTVVNSSLFHSFVFKIYSQNA